MEAEITRNENTVAIAPVGRLDTVTSAELKQMITDFGVANCDLDLDFKKVEYISSAGLRLLVALQKQAKATGNGIVIRNINVVVSEVFRVSGFNKTFTVL